MTSETENPILPEAAKRSRGRPMMTLRGAVSVLDKTEDEIIEAIDCGELLWAFDVCANPKTARAKELRILPDAVVDYAQGRTCSLKWDEVFKLLVPHDDDPLLTMELQHCLNVSNTHLLHLADLKLLHQCSARRRGPGGMAKFTRASFCNFLTARRVL